MQRREILSTVTLGAIAATAGCLDDVRGFIEELEDDESSGIVERQESGTFEIEAEEGDEIVTDVTIEEAGDGRAQVVLYDPDGNELESHRFFLSGHREQVSVTAPRDGRYSASVNPGSDRETKLRVNLRIA